MKWNYVVTVNKVQSLRNQEPVTVNAQDYKTHLHINLKVCVHNVKISLTHSRQFSKHLTLA